MPCFIQNYRAGGVEQGAILTHVVGEGQRTAQVPMELLHGHLQFLLRLIVPHAERSHGGHGKERSIE